MKRTAGISMLLATVGGCMATELGSNTSPTTSCGGGWGGGFVASVPTLQGPWGQPVPMVPPYTATPPNGEEAARAMLARSVPLDLMPQGAPAQAGNIPASMAMPPGLAHSASSPIVQAQYSCPQGGCMSPPGISPPGMPGPMAMGMPGMGAGSAMSSGSNPSQYATHRTSVRFQSPAGMKVSWYAPSPDGRAGLATNQLIVPGRYNFLQAAVYRLKISNIPNRPGLELYPTLEVVPGNAKTATFLAHSSVPVVFTDEDFEQVAANNYIVKVIYLPFPQFQDLATTGPDEVVSSRLEPGADPIAEACRRGNILLVVRMGNIDLEAPNTPAMDAPSPYMLRPGMGQGPGAGHSPIPTGGPLGIPLHGPMVPTGPATSGPAGSCPPGVATAESQTQLPASKRPSKAMSAIEWVKGQAESDPATPTNKGRPPWWRSEWTPSDK